MLGFCQSLPWPAMLPSMIVPLAEALCFVRMALKTLRKASALAAAHPGRLPAYPGIPHSYTAHHLTDEWERGRRNGPVGGRGLAGSLVRRLAVGRAFHPLGEPV